MIEYENEYIQWISECGVGQNDRVASSTSSYRSYLKSVARHLKSTISPSNLSTHDEIKHIVKSMKGAFSEESISNYKTAMSHYVDMVKTKDLKSTAKFQLYPIQQFRIIDLVSLSGIDVSTWKSSTDPRYCFEWTFGNPADVAVLCLWFENMEELDGVICQKLNLRQTADRLTQGSQKRRAKKMDHVIETAFDNNYPIHVIVCIGCSVDSQTSSRAKRRLLDPIQWRVSAYDNESGECTLTRGLPTITPRDNLYIDDTYDDMPLSDYSQIGSDGAAITSSLRSNIKRDRLVRLAVLQRAKGKCERNDCGESRDYEGFLDVHHILGAAKSDRYWNCVALCPNCHREVHAAPFRDDLNKDLMIYASNNLKENP